MKKFLTVLLLLLILGCGYWYRNDIIRFIMINVVYHDKLFLEDGNYYTRTDSWDYVKETDDFYPNNRQDILNIFYTALNRGWNEVTFYCDEKYPNCMDDVKNLTNENETLSIINNFVPTLNSYNRIFVNMNIFGRVHIEIEKLYSEKMKKQIEEKIDSIYQELITEQMDSITKIRTIHNYIINHTTYDQEHANILLNGATNITFKSNTAYGPLFEGKAICGGYTDAMALFLDKMNIPNYKISSEKHIWNFLNIDGKWRHLDLTWDDPVVSTGENILSDTFFLISTKELEKQNTGQHIYQKNIYIEAN